jgi:hypothetical protein
MWSNLLPRKNTPLMMATNDGHQLELHCWVIGPADSIICKVGRPSKQWRKKSALILASQFGALFDYGTLLLLVFLALMSS